MIVGRGVTITLAILTVIFSSLTLTISSIIDVPRNLLGGEDIIIITRAGDPNPLRSSMDIEIAYALQNLSFVEVVSPEIIVFSTYKERAITIRGVWYENFLKIEKGTVVEGRLPVREDECLVGSGLKKRLDIKLGEEVTIFGSFKSSLSILKVVGIFRTPSLSNDELLVSLPIARNLCGLDRNSVSIIRVRSENKEKMRLILDPYIPKFILTDLNVPLNAYLYDSIPVKFRIRNWGMSNGTAHMVISFCDKQYNVTVSMDGNRAVEYVVNVSASRIGQEPMTIELRDLLIPSTHTLMVNITKRPIFVSSPSLMEVNKNYTIFVSSVDGPLYNARVLYEDEEVFTDKNGNVNISFRSVGTKNLQIEKLGHETVEVTIKVIEYVPPEALFSIENPKSTMNLTEFYLINSSKILRLRPSSDKVRFSYGIQNSTKVSVENNNILLDWIDGWYNITIHAEDDYNITSLNVTIYIDSKPPTITANYISPTNLKPGETLKIKVQDDFYLSYCRIKIFNSSYSIEILNSSLEISNTSSFRGEYFIEINSTDLANNWKNTTLYYIFAENPDFLAPSINYTSNDSVINPGQTVKFKIHDNFRLKNATLKILYEQNLFRKTEYTFSSSIAIIMIDTFLIDQNTVRYWQEGNYTFTLYVEDIHKNSHYVSHRLLISNKPDTMPPIIISEEKSILRDYETLNVSIWDNYLLTKVGYNSSNTTFLVSVETKNFTLRIPASLFLAGSHEIEIFAEDSYGNNNSIKITITVLMNHTPRAIINHTAYLIPEEISVNETAVIVVEIRNSGDAAGQLYINITIDGKNYTRTLIVVPPQEHLTLTYSLPPLSPGKHTISLLNYTFTLCVYRHTIANIPVEKIIRYTKDIDIKAKGETVYKALELSEGNFIILIFSILSTVVALLSMGIVTIFSKNLRSREKNVGILRVLGAVKSKIIKITLQEILVKCTPAVILGTLIGYFIVKILSENGYISAFGHSLVFSPAPHLIAIIIIIPISTIIVVGSYLTYRILHKKPIEIMKRLPSQEESFDLRGLLEEST